MQHILVYGDSLSWGIIPDTRERLPFEARWPIVMEQQLHSRGHAVRVIEDCLNGRRTVWEDPFKPGRNGLHGLAQRIEVNSPLALVILMLGSNDFQSMHPHNPWHAAQGMATLVNAIRTAPIEPGMPVPPILIVAPPEISAPQGSMAEKFRDGDKKCRGLAAAYLAVAEELGCEFFDTGSVITTSKVDGVHLDAGQHAALGESLSGTIEKLLIQKNT